MADKREKRGIERNEQRKRVVNVLTDRPCRLSPSPIKVSVRCACSQPMVPMWLQTSVLCPVV